MGPYRVLRLSHFLRAISWARRIRVHLAMTPPAGSAPPEPAARWRGSEPAESKGADVHGKEKDHEGPPECGKDGPVEAGVTNGAQPAIRERERTDTGTENR
jgi:hypothetical protein